MDADAIVFVVEDDAPLRASLQNLLRSVGLRVAAFACCAARASPASPERPAARSGQAPPHGRW